MRPNERAGGALLGPAGLVGLFALYMGMRPLGLHVSDSYEWVIIVDGRMFQLFFHPHQILYIPVAWAWNSILAPLTPWMGTWARLSALSAAFGCAGAAALYKIARLFNAGRAQAAGAAGIAALSFGYWFFASDPKGWTMSAACVLWSFYWLARLALEGRLMHAVWAGTAAAFAALFHQTGIFAFVAAAGTAFAIQGWRRRLAAIGLFTAAFGILVAPVYIAGAWAVLPRLMFESFMRWLFLHPLQGYGGASFVGSLGSSIGFARALVGSALAFDVLRGVRAAGAALWVGLGAGAAAFALLAVFYVRGLAAVRSLGRTQRDIVLSFGACLAVYCAFSADHDPANFEWWIIPISILAALAGAAFGARFPARLAAAAIACLLIANLVLDFNYRRRPDCDFVVAAARSVAAQTGARDVIVAPSLLAARMSFEYPERAVFCPDKAWRIYGREGLAAELAAQARTAGPGARVVIAGALADENSRPYTEALFRNFPESVRRRIGQFRFIDGRRRFVDLVGEVPLEAVDAAEYAARMSATASAKPMTRTSGGAS